MDNGRDAPGGDHAQGHGQRPLGDGLAEAQQADQRHAWAHEHKPQHQRWPKRRLPAAKRRRTGHTAIAARAQPIARLSIDSFEPGPILANSAAAARSAGAGILSALNAAK